MEEVFIRVLEVSSACVSCKICSKKRPMGISPYEYKGEALNHPDCIQCAKCAIACPARSIGYKKNLYIKKEAL